MQCGALRGGTLWQLLPCEAPALPDFPRAEWLERVVALHAGRGYLTASLVLHHLAQHSTVTAPGNTGDGGTRTPSEQAAEAVEGQLLELAEQSRERQQVAQGHVQVLRARGLRRRQRAERSMQAWRSTARALHHEVAESDPGPRAVGLSEVLEAVLQVEEEAHAVWETMTAEGQASGAEGRAFQRAALVDVHKGGQEGLFDALVASEGGAVQQAKL